MLTPAARKLHSSLKCKYFMEWKYVFIVDDFFLFWRSVLNDQAQYGELQWGTAPQWLGRSMGKGMGTGQCQRYRTSAQAGLVPGETKLWEAVDQPCWGNAGAGTAGPYGAEMGSWAMGRVGGAQGVARKRKEWWYPQDPDNMKAVLKTWVL